MDSALKQWISLNFIKNLGVMTDTSSACNHQSVGSVERMVQTVKQIMTRNPENTRLAMLIFKATWIPEIYKSPGELLYLKVSNKFSHDRLKSE